MWTEIAEEFKGVSRGKSSLKVEMLTEGVERESRGVASELS